MDSTAFVVLDRVTRRYGSLTVLDHVSLAVEEGEVLVLLGPSGSGKTTLLRCLAGFDPPDAGTITIAGRDITRLPPAQRDVGMVFQHYALFPHLDVASNVGFGLAGRLDRSARAQRVDEVLDLVELRGFAARPVDALSGGQQQRVAVARALAPRPRVVLFDEPLSNLDPELRERTRANLRALLREIGITAVVVTHEQDEAFDLGDRVAVLHRGRLEQVATPEQLYREPATPFVARFIGRGAFLPGSIGGGAARPDGARHLAWPFETSCVVAEGDAVELFVRPEQWTLGEQGLSGTVTARRFRGAESFLAVRLDAGGTVEVATRSAPAEGDRLHLTLDPGARVRAFGPHRET